jgi:O-acetyl-ADP-ribose deacetylase (regulator of RNase III)
VIKRMLRKQPEERYPNAGAVFRALRPISEPLADFTSDSGSEFRVGDLTVSLSVGDLAAVRAAVIVNAANVGLDMRIGVAAALRDAGGDVIEQEAMTQAPSAMGAVVWTAAGALQARWVAHAVSAIDGAICLGRCTLRALIGAELRAADSIAFPALGTGVGGVPMALGAKRTLEAIRTFARLRPAHVRSVRVVLVDQSAAEQWRAVLQSMCA